MAGAVPELLDDAHKAEWRASLEKVRTALKVVAGALDVYTQITNHEFAHVYLAVAVAAAELIKEKLGNELDKKVQKYLPFVVEIAAAKTADDVKHTLESFAAPVGAGRAKRGTDRRTVTLTAFVGATGGLEWAYRSDGPTNRSLQGGLFMPVGIDFNKGFCDSFSVGGFVSLVDIGALATFREKAEDSGAGTTVESAPQVGLKQVFSPGAYLVLGWDRFAFGVGASLSPELRKISMDGALVENASSLRFGVFAAIDVTIFPF